MSSLAGKLYKANVIDIKFTIPVNDVFRRILTVQLLA